MALAAPTLPIASNELLPILDDSIRYFRIKQSNSSRLAVGDIIGVSHAHQSAPNSMWLIRRGTEYLLKPRSEIEPNVKRACLHLVGQEPRQIEVLGLVVYWRKG